MRTFLAVVMMASVVWLGASSLSAQRRGVQRGGGQGRVGRMAMETLRTTATVKAATPRMLQVVTDDGQQWLVSVPANLENLVFQATATPDWLRPGMTVRFNATVTMEKRMREITIKDPITELTVATVRPNVGMGVFPENQYDQRNDLFGGKSETRKKSGGSEPVETSCLIIGRLVEHKEGRLRIAAGRIPVKAELADKAEVTVEVHDVMWVRPGDKVELTARFIPGRAGRAEGQQMTITAAAPLTGKEGAEKGARRGAHGQKVDESAEGKEKEKRKEKEKEKEEERKID